MTERSTGGGNSAEYCYWVWLHHVVIARENGLIESHPTVVAELGPGESLGAGLAAIAAGARDYTALDVIEYANRDRNIAVLDELVELFRRQAPISQPGHYSVDEAQSFPNEWLTDDRLDGLLAPERLTAIRAAVTELGTKHSGIRVGYDPDWRGSPLAPERAPEMLFSQAVLEHVDDLAETYEAMARWLPKGAVMSHEIDFQSHDFARAWNGHWTYSDARWKMIRGRRRYAINREPLSHHLMLMRKSGFHIVDVRRHTADSTIERHQLAPRFRSMTDEDIVTAAATVQAVRE